jgi:hypothetical protein
VCCVCLLVYIRSGTADEGLDGAHDQVVESEYNVLASKYN